MTQVPVQGGALLPVFQLVHVVSVVMFFGGLLPMTILAPRVLGERNPDARLAGVRLLILLNRGLLMPGSILAGLTGFALAGAAHLPVFRTPWLCASLVMYLVAMVTSMAVLAPHTARLLAAASDAAAHPDRPDTFPELAAAPVPKLMRAVNALLAAGILILMVLRPH